MRQGETHTFRDAIRSLRTKPQVDRCAGTIAMGDRTRTSVGTGSLPGFLPSSGRRPRNLQE
eukprot:41096-Prymnesium_polylepis.1